MHPLLNNELARERIDERLEIAAGRRAPARPRPRRAWRLVVGSHLIALGCRVWLSADPPGAGTSTIPDPRIVR